MNRIALAERLTETAVEHTVGCPLGDELVSVLSYCDHCGAMGRRTIKEQELRERVAVALRRSLGADARVRLYRGADAALMGKLAEQAAEDVKEAFRELELLLGEPRMTLILQSTGAV